MFYLVGPHIECQDGLACGSNNCPASLGFDFEVDCCYSCPGTCGNPSWKGDNYCDDENNNCGCEWDGGDCCGSNVNTYYCSICLCLDPNALGSRKSQYRYEAISKSENLKLVNSSKEWKYLRPNDLQHTKAVQEVEEMSLNLLTYRKRNRMRSKYSNSNLRKTSTKPNSEIELRNSPKASSKYGLTVILNPNEAEYTDALKNNFVGFKTLVHTPYNFPEVDAVGMAMDKNVQATVGIRGHHSFITDAANGLGLYQKKCLSRSDNVTKYNEVILEVFAKYTRKGCILECHANIFYDKCGCLPYHYPDFSAVWNKTTNCNHTALQCISKLVGK